jgi:hypothetical protein
MNYTLASLQGRRSAALESGDMEAYWAFDMLIGHVLGEAAMYARNNRALSSDPHDADPYGMHEERRRHP